MAKTLQNVVSHVVSSRTLHQIGEAVNVLRANWPQAFKNVFLSYTLLKIEANTWAEWGHLCWKQDFLAA